MWKEENKTLFKQFDFKDFKSALVFVNQVGELAETANHHPDIELGWGKVVVKLTTHDQGGVTDKDEHLADQIDKI